MRRVVWLAVMLSITVIGFAGCGKEKTEQVEITLIHGWGTMEPDHVTMRQIYKDFEEETPDIRLNLVSMPSTDEVISKASDMMAVGKIPDLIFLGGDGRDDIYQFVEKKGYAVDLMPYIREDADFASDLSQELLAYWTTKDDQLYTISDVLLLSGGYWYNVDLFRAAGINEIPRTWDAFFDVCDRLAAFADKKGIDLTPIQINPENSIYLLDAFLAEEGSRPPRR